MSASLFTAERDAIRVSFDDRGAAIHAPSGGAEPVLIDSGRWTFRSARDQREIQALAREFAQAEIEPNAAAWDREHHFPRELFAKLAELGLMGVCVPEEYGGAGADFVSYILVLEELSRADAGVGVTVAVHTSAVTLPLLAFGTDEQKSRFVPPLARGEHLGAFALTEPEAGSDAGSLRTAAVPEGRGLAHLRREAVDHERRVTRGRSCSSRAPTPRRPERAASPPSCSTRSTCASRATRRSSGSTPP